MFNLLIISEKNASVTELCSRLVRNGYSCPVITDENEAIEQITGRDPDLVLLTTSATRIRELCQKIKQKRDLPIIALVTRAMLNSVNGHQDIDDFLVEPYDITELLCRIKRLLNITADNDNDELIKCGDLTIDLARYEVSVGNRPVMLTFREYELLKFLASNGGRVFTREALLNKVWGYDYYGGDRTVDVHIRRLRSKLEDATHTFIETVRNIGYRFRESN